MHTMITIGDHTFPFELAHFHRYTSTSDEGTRTTTYSITLPEIREGNNEGFGSQSYQFWVDNPYEVQAIDLYLQQNAVTLTTWMEKYALAPKEE